MLCFIVLQFFFLTESLCRWRRSFLVSFVFGAPVMIAMILFSILKSKDKEPHVEIISGLSLENLIYFLLCTPVQVSHTAVVKLDM